MKLALGESLFEDRQLSHDGTFACSSCHDIHTNGADKGSPSKVRDGSPLSFNIPTVFNAALSFRLNGEGNQRSLEVQAQSSFENIEVATPALTKFCGS
ncbi:cytochrome-c peroxidase [Rhodopila sp.]|uniref:cytochrome-c peroxidase n=1 Tax=Rhodopila sp. TaxID=2480087 RepID=UPI003D0E8975